MWKVHTGNYLAIFAGFYLIRKNPFHFVLGNVFHIPLDPVRGTSLLELSKKQSPLERCLSMAQILKNYNLPIQEYKYMLRYPK